MTPKTDTRVLYEEVLRTRTRIVAYILAFSSFLCLSSLILPEKSRSVGSDVFLAIFLAYVVLSSPHKLVVSENLLELKSCVRLNVWKTNLEDIREIAFTHGKSQIEITYMDNSWKRVKKTRCTKQQQLAEVLKAVAPHIQITELP